MAKLPYSHRLVVEAVVDKDGVPGLCGITYAKLPEGMEFIGNGTLPHPLDVDASALIASRNALRDALGDLIAAITEHAQDSLEVEERLTKCKAYETACRMVQP